jgi:uncharacterized protein YbbC (DUF1343 family)
MPTPRAPVSPPRGALLFALSTLVTLVAVVAVAAAPRGASPASAQAAAPAAKAAAPSAPRAAAPAPRARVARAAGDVDLAALDRIAPAVEAAIADRKMPGAVALIGRGDTIVYERAFGNRALEPAVEPMTLDTVFDAASLTKVIATTTAVMQLVEQGRVRLTDRVSTYVPGFERHGKESITVRHLLTHTSGLRPDLDLSDQWNGYDTAIARAVEEVPSAALDARFIYSDINFFLLGHIVAKVSGEPLDRYTLAHVFEPLGMMDTCFNPPPALVSRIAPTQRCTPLGWPCDGPGQVMLRGTVHDPTARRMGGVAGHAGMFTTARDLSRFARALLNGGTLEGVRVLSPLSVQRMTTPSTPEGMPNVRGLGWDIDSQYSSNRGELFPFGSFGHTGYTGTSIWIDPASRAYVILLTNRVHPDDKGDATPLRARVATIAASAMRGVDVPVKRAIGMARAASGGGVPATVEPTLTGLDVLRAEGFAPLQGRRVGLVTNHTGRARDGAPAIDLLHQAKGLQLVALFSPEHGIRGILDEEIPSSRDEKTGLVIHSLYGKTRRPTDEMLEGIDTLVVDLQDIGTRFYTYTSTMAYVMEEAAKRKIRVFVLDRPNPVNGWQIEGPTVDKESLGFVAYFPMPVRHGMTLGELAKLFNAENTIGADLVVVPMKNWTRGQWFDETGLPWINPSPNMRNMTQAALYPGVGSIEYANLSVGRGTNAPFEQVGAPWINGVELASSLNARKLAGVRFYPVSFTPASSKYKDEACQGVYMTVTDRDALRPVRVGLEIASALHRLYGAKFEVGTTAKLLGSSAQLAQVASGVDPAKIAATWSADEARWRLRRAKYLLYP